VPSCFSRNGDGGMIFLLEEPCLKHQRQISLALIVLGLGLFIVGTYPNLLQATLRRGAIVYTDSSPPEWLLNSPNELALYPKDGGVYSTIVFLSAGVKDIESGVVSVTATLDGVVYSLSRSVGDPYYGAVYRVVVPALPEGPHTITYVATNGVGLQTTYSGQFTIYAGLQGDWFINDLKVQSSDQTFYFNTTTLTFKFVKTMGADGSINCYIVENGATIGSLTYQGSGSSTWSGTVTFSGGVHVLALKASDGTNLVTMELLSLSFGGLSLSNTQICLYGGGVACVGLGGYGLLIKKRRRIG